MIDIRISISENSGTSLDHLTAILARDINGQWVGFGPIIQADNVEGILQRAAPHIETKTQEVLTKLLPCGCSTAPGRLLIGCDLACQLYEPVAQADLGYHAALLADPESPETYRLCIASLDAYADFAAHFMFQ